MLLPEALAQLHEATARVARDRALGKLIPGAERKIARAFDRQGTEFLKRFARRKGRFPVEESLREGTAEDLYWEPLFTEAEIATLLLLEGPIAALIAASMQAGIRVGIADLAVKSSFNLADPRAAAWLRGRAAARVAGINNTTREGLRTLLTQAMKNGWSYDKTAKAIREQFDGFAGKRPQQHIRSRAHLVATTEAGDAYARGNLMVGQELAAAGLEMEKRWLTVGDARVSDLCLGNEAAGWIPIADSFPSGHDCPLGHPACVPGFVMVSGPPVTAAAKRLYDGDLLVIRTAGGKELSCTPNHPILTPSGWVSAHLLEKGSDVVCGGFCERMAMSLQLNDQDMPTSIEDVTEAFGSSQNVVAVPVPTSAEDFHGDGVGSEIAVVWADGLLRDSPYATFQQHGRKSQLVRGGMVARTLAAKSRLAALLHRGLASAHSLMGRLRVAPVFFACAAGHHQPVSLGHVATHNALFVETFGDNRPLHSEAFGDAVLGLPALIQGHDLRYGQLDPGASRWHAMATKPSIDSAPMDTQLASDILSGHAGTITIEKVTDLVRREGWNGHVFNLQTVEGYFIAGGIVTHNCRCDALYQRKPTS